MLLTVKCPLLPVLPNESYSLLDSLASSNFLTTCHVVLLVIVYFFIFPTRFFADSKKMIMISNSASITH